MNHAPTAAAEELHRALRSALTALCATTLLAVGASGCMSAAGEANDQLRDRSAEPTVPRYAEQGYYRVTRPDYRKCMWPMCGGVFVARVNQAETECLDGSSAADCYVADIDLTPIAASDAALAELAALADAGQAIVRGQLQTIVSQHGEAPVLVASEGWRGRPGTAPVGTFYHVVESGIVCVTWPCPSVKELALNVGSPVNVAGVDLEASGADDEALAEAQAALFAGGVLVAGGHRAITGPGGDGLVLEATELYTRVGAEPAPPTGVACGQSVCDAHEICCNPSCGICTAPGSACIELACAPCGHSVCEAGAALDQGCDACVGKVCTEDPYCCDVAWDALCVEEGAEACGSCEDEEPSGCAHSECDEGAALDAPCSPCAASICQQDAFCCDVAWDGLCVEEATEQCEQCEPPAPTCAHSECAAGDALDEGCSACAAGICELDPYCCTVAWDSLCVDAAELYCAACAG